MEKFKMLVTERQLRNIVRKILMKEGVYDPGILKAVFMAGGPGSGKSFTAKTIFGGDPKSTSSLGTTSGLKFVNSDPAFEKFLHDAGISPKDLGSMPKDEFEVLTDPSNPESIRSRASSVKKRQQKAFTGPDTKLGVIIDGTGDDYKKLARKKQELEDLGYDTYMVFVNTSLEVAQERNAKRDRVLPTDLVEEIWSDVQQNLGAFQNLFGANNIVIVDNTVYGPLPEAIQKAVNSFLAQPIKNRIGRQWIENELGQRGGGTKKERSRLLGR
jgi:cytidylate kinase